MQLDVIGLFIVFFLGVLGGGWWLWSRSRKERADTLTLDQAVQAGRGIPPTLHPVIDPDLCIGSLACLSVCPEGNILGVVDGKAKLINPAACIGHGKCYLECPVGAIRLVFGTSERGVDLPEVDAHFETQRPGVFVVGELGGMGLIKNALQQGLQCADHLVGQLRGGATTGVAIVGAGPAGLATALGLRKHNIPFQLLEQGAVGGTVAHYPRQKIVMTERLQLPLVGRFGKALISKEELIAAFGTIQKRAGIQVRTGVQVTRIDGHNGAFTVQTGQGPVEAQRVVLAIGRRGTPRKLGVPGEELAKVSYSLVDPRQYEGASVLVVGGGDSALEAAISLAEESDADVSLSYRNAEFSKCRDANRRKVQALIANGRIRAWLPSRVVRIYPEFVHLEFNGKRVERSNDFVLACLGGELPSEFLTQNGIALRRYQGEALGQGADAATDGHPSAGRRGSAKRAPERQRRRRVAVALWALGVGLTGVFALVGWEYYPLSRMERLRHPLHALLKPAGAWGHGVGIVATAFMLSNFLYSARKRVAALRPLGSLRSWLTFHQFVGIMSPVAIAFHAAFQSNNVLATTTSASVAVVVGTGLVGRFLFGLVPSGEADEKNVKARFEAMRSRLAAAIDAHPSATFLRKSVAVMTPRRGLAGLGSTLRDHLTSRGRLLRAKQGFASRAEYAEMVDQLKELQRARLQATFYSGLKRLMSIWRVFHVILALMLVVLIAAHIGVSLYLGFHWVFR